MKCPKCSNKIWDKATKDQALNKCWKCGLRFDYGHIKVKEIKYKD